MTNYERFYLIFPIDSMSALIQTMLLISNSLNVGYCDLLGGVYEC